MEKIILGILMLKRMSPYEVHIIIKNNFQDMCSDSLGSIQSTMKKLFERGMLTRKELDDTKLKKKVYAITDDGRAYFMEWLKNPMDMGKAKNVELAKFFYLGFTSPEEQIKSLEATLQQLKEHYAYLQAIYRSINDISAIKVDYLQYLNQDPEYASVLSDISNKQDLHSRVESISEFQLATLEYGVDSTKFNIEWFQKKLQQLQNTRRKKHE